MKGKKGIIKAVFAAALIITTLASLSGCGKTAGSGREETEVSDDLSIKETASKELSFDELPVKETDFQEDEPPSKSGTSGQTGEEETKTSLIAMAEQGFTTSIDCEPVILSLGCTADVDETSRGDAIAEAMKAVSRWTDGNFQVNFYPGGQLGGDLELAEGVSAGTIDLFTGTPTALEEQVPELAIFDIGGLYSDIETANQVLGDFKDSLEPYCQAAGLTLMTLYAPDFRVLTSSRPVKTAADLSGLKVRTQENEFQMAFWEELGAKAVPLSFGKVYLALSQGELDAEENSWDVIAGSKFYEVQSHVTLTNHLPFITIFAMNKEKYDSLSESQKLACSQFITFCQRYQMAAVKEDDQRLETFAKEEAAMTVSPVTEEIKALYPAASQAVISLLKETLDPELVDQYVLAAGVRVSP